ncbi:MAG: HIT domain-containing protein [Methylococcaceae bacterium]
MMSTFELHPRLTQDCISVGQFNLCRLLLMNDSHYPWFILVPQRADVSEIYQLSFNDRALLLEESCYLAEQLALLYQADKLNIATIGNKVAQLHVHHIVRYQHDCAWPEPVWGKFPALAYDEAQLAQQLTRIRTQLQDKLL